jgi:branched-chain amino acid transport system ATP-binding protein
MTLLAVEQLHAGYGRTPALFGVDLTVAAGEIVALLGRNGVGKTTTLRSIVGLTTRTSGRIALEGTPIERLPTHAIARKGVSFVPEDRGVFPGLTVGENLRLGRLAGRGANGDRDRVFARFPVLAAEGLQPNLVQELATGLEEIAASGVGILLVEQNASLALRISARCYVMEKGRVVDEGTSSLFLSDEQRLREHLVI